MPNSYFQFKQFRIQQDNCAMKVCTDSCMFGAWIPVADNVQNILDIGAGTGLLSLMLAQKSNAFIDAIEIDLSAFEQASENIHQSIWRDKIHIIHRDIKEFEPKKKYDLIVCNPPFYEKDVLSEQLNERVAKHSSHLTLNELLQTVKLHISNAGQFAILLPYKRKIEFEKIAANIGLFPHKILLLKQTPKHDYFRYIALCSTSIAENIITETICIKDENNQYSQEATHLLKPYYLHL